jgi:AsmA family protein
MPSESAPDTPHEPTAAAAEGVVRTTARRAGRVARWVGLTLAGLVVLVLAVVAWIAFIGITIDASSLRPRIAAAFSDALKREVRFDGPAQLEISAQPKLKVGGLAIADPGGFAEGTLVSVGEVRLALDLWKLIGHRVHIQDLAGSDVALKLRAHADGTNNWTFAIPPSGDPPKPKSDAPADTETAMDAAAMLDVRRFALERIAVEYTAAGAKSHFFSLDSLQGESPSGQPMKLAMQGHVEKSFPYKVAFTGGSLQALLAATKPWPFDFRVDFLSSMLTLKGAVAGTSGDVDFSVGTSDLAEVERLLQATYPKVGATELSGHVRFTPKTVDITGLAGKMGKTVLSGNLSFDQRGTRPSITGKLALPSLDLRPFLTDNPDEAEEPPKSFRDTYRELAKATFSLSGLKAADVDLELQVDRWLSLPGDARDANVHLVVKDGRLDAPIKATITDVALEGRITADGTMDPPRFALTLGTKDSDLGGLAELFAGAKGMKGHVGRFAVAVKAEGDQGAELVKSLDVQIDLDKSRLSYGNLDGGRPVEFTVEKFTVDLPAGKPLMGSLVGSLLSQPLKAALTGGSLETVMLEEGSPLDFSIQSGSVRARLQGVLVAPTPTTGPSLAFDLTANKTSEVAKWLGLEAKASAPVALKGKASMTEGTWKVDDVVFRLGRTNLVGNAALVPEGNRRIVRVRLDVGEIDTAELQSLIPPSKPKPVQANTPGRPVLELPILPKGIDMGDADLKVRVKRITGTSLNPRDISFDGHIRDGAMQPSPFAATVADIPFSGAVSLDLRSDPISSLWLAAGPVDIGKLLRTLGLAQNIDATVGAVQIALIARSTLLGDMLAKSELIGNIDKGKLVIRDANTKAEARIQLDAGEITAKPGQPVRIALKGSLDDVPITLGLETAKAADLVRPDGRIPFTFTAEAADTRVKLTGAISKPVGEGDIELALALDGKRFDSLNRLARTSLPPWGPYSLGGKFRMSKQGYEVADLAVRVGASRLQGRGALVTARAKPKLTIDLASPSIQLDDFKLDGWSATEKKPEKKKEEPEKSAEEVKAEAEKATNEAQKMLSPEVMRRQDAYITVRVDEVLSGKDKMGSGRLDAKLENGRADIGPMEVNVPGGSARLWLGYEPTDTEVKVDTKVRIERFDYGILARRFQPDADYKGLLTLRMDVNSRAKYLADILEKGNGSLEFAVWPENMPSGLADLWAVNVLSALLPAVDPDKASKINCAVARFDLKDGLLTHKTIVMDTSRMRVTGSGGVDFRNETLQFRMAPQGKKPEFLSVAIPVEVKGSFKGFDVGVSAGDVIGTVGRFATSIFWVPIQRLIEKPLPKDGGDVCGNALGAANG